MKPIGSNAREGIVGKGLPRLRDAHAYGVVLGLVVAVMEALFGQLYLVTVVAVLVSSFGRRRGPD